MKKTAHALFAAASLLLLSACATLNPASPQPPHSVLLVSIDGFRPDYLGKGMTPNLDRIAAEGVRAEWMNPSFPSLTFPNHYTLVTGLRPDHHGIVHNTMRDKELGEFSLGNREAVQNPAWWGGEPIWIAVNNAGWPSASMFWPGSEAPIQGQHPTRWSTFDAKVTYKTRVDTVAGWLREPLTTRPRFATLYFDGVDHEAHGFGPLSEEAKHAVRDADAAIGDLYRQMATDGSLAYTDIIVVSDHGMAEVPADHAVVVDDMVHREWAKATSIGQVVTLEPNPGFAAQSRQKLLGKHPHYECWEKGSIPANFHYGSNPRIPSIVCLMETGWDAVTRENLAKRAKTKQMRGSHGFDPYDPAMRASFLAIGPDFAQGKVIPAFDNVNVYPLLRKLLQLPAKPSDGSITPLQPALRQAN